MDSLPISITTDSAAVTILQGALAFVVILVAVAKPLMGFYREYIRTDAEGAKLDADKARSGAEMTLYNALQAQITLLSKDLDRIRAERDELSAKTARLELDVARLITLENTVEILYKQLAQKDELMSHKDAEIARLTERLYNAQKHND